VLLLVVLHSLALVAVLLLPAAFWVLLPLVLLSAAINMAKHGLLLLRRSVVRVWLEDSGWYLQLRDQTVQGPFTLAASSRLGSQSVRISLRRKGSWARHILLTRSMIGSENFRKLQVLLRWATSTRLATKQI
jgi:hypothetical protein